MDTLTAPDPTSPHRRRWPSALRRLRASDRRGWLLVALSVLVAGLLLFHRAVPNTVGHLGSLLESLLPWLGLAVPVLAGLALLRRSAVALAAVVVPAAAWLHTFGATLPPDPAAPHDLTVVQHNVSDENPDPAGTAKALLAAAPDLVALEEVTPLALRAYAAELAGRLPYHAVEGTVGLWSRYPISGARLVEIRPRAIVAEWSRGMRATVHTPHGDVAVYVAHLPSLRLRPTDGFGSTTRDDSAAQLGAALAAEPLPRLILIGDLNGTVDDRGLRPVTAQVGTDRSDFAFSWPAAAPVARIDHVMARTAQVVRAWSLPRTGSDHLPLAARVRL
ncbi:endonuclease/exonuclease/phosphatase family protein [Catellatospora sp. NPDC049609]|uniref:endonuclease/exonuclease/phosphatase family protein n=1 Tax=Catellatospora sp. NPDC049609 TaxID=3155505 RepID=UPI00342EAC43